MDSGDDSTKSLVTSSTRHKCAACFKQYKKKEHLIAHMKTSYHSVHQPKCGICQKHFKSFESLREHTTGNCSNFFAERGCKLCMRILDSPDILDEHLSTCCLPAPSSIFFTLLTGLNEDAFHIISNLRSSIEIGEEGHPEAIALNCEMVGGGSDGSLDLCVRVCLVDEDEKPIFHTYVVPQIPVTNYRYEITGITEDHLRDAMPLKEVQEKILQILYNGESIGRLRLSGGRARVLVGHNLEHDLACLRMNYPDHMLRDTALYPPLMKTNVVSHSLKYLVKTYLGYDIQLGTHDPYEDCVSALRLYKRFRAKKHQAKEIVLPLASRGTSSLTNIYDSWNRKELENMSPEELFDISKSKYKCWCLD